MNQRHAEPDAVPLDDRGLLLGDGLFETLLWSGGALILGPEHGRRMIRGAGVIGLPAPSLTEFLAGAKAAVRRAGLVDQRAAVRVTLTAGSGGRGLDRPAAPTPRLFAAAAPAPRTGRPAALALALVRRNAASPASRLKTLGYLDNVLAREEARAQGVDEAVMLGADGSLACAAAANLFWVCGEGLFTPAPEAGCLEGIMRAAVLSAATDLGVEVRQVLAGPEALATADAVFLTNSLIGVRAVTSFGGRVYAPHPLASRLAQATARFS